MPPFQLVDAFTGTPFSGNAAGVVVLDTSPDVAWAQQVAAEVAASETAFVHPDGEGWALRWWTPTTEVALCGHATLAAAHVLWSIGASDDQTLRFATRSGVLTATRRDGRIALDLPAWPVEPHPEPAGIDRLLAGTGGRYLGRTSAAVDQPNDVVELGSEAQVRRFDPDRETVLALGTAGLIVTAPADPATGDDLVSRYFAPAVGIDEDPVTGSAHATLGPLWAQRLGRGHLVARQVSPRGGRLWLEVHGDRVEVAGEAVTVIAGTLAADRSTAPDPVP